MRFITIYVRAHDDIFDVHDALFACDFHLIAWQWNNDRSINHSDGPKHEYAVFGVRNGPEIVCYGWISIIRTRSAPNRMPPMTIFKCEFFCTMNDGNVFVDAPERQKVRVCEILHPFNSELNAIAQRSQTANETRKSTRRWWIQTGKQTNQRPEKKLRSWLK